MKTFLLLVAVALLAGCGSGSPAKEAPSLDTKRASRIAAGEIQPTEFDYLVLDVAPLVNGVSVPNGIIDLGDVIVLMRRNLNLI